MNYGYFYLFISILAILFIKKARLKADTEIAIELSEKQGVKRVYIKAVDDYSRRSLTPIFEEHISTKAKVLTDKWRGCSPLKKKYNIEQIACGQGKNFKQLHLHCSLNKDMDKNNPYPCW